MRQFGLIGFPLSHSFSKKYFDTKFDNEAISGCCYSLFELKTINEFPAFIKQNPHIEGLNVTIPYKQTVIPLLDSVTAEAAICGAVNCIKIENKKLIGCNTDVFGFLKSFQSFLDANGSPSIQLLQCFVLGNGGASKAVQLVLKNLNARFITVSRNKTSTAITYSEIQNHLQPSGNVFINTTPVGMFPDVDKKPAVPYHLLEGNNLFFDLVYNPAETTFLKEAQKTGARTKNGLEMLHLQAQKSWEIWNGPNLFS